MFKTHQSDDEELIPHINLVALTSHITSRRSRHIHLNYFGVILLPMPSAAFLLLFVFSLVGVLFAWFLWTLAIIYIYTSLSLLYLSFCCYLIVVACMKLFCTDVHPTGELPHPHARWSVCWIFHSWFSWTINHYCYHLVSPCIYCLSCFSCPSASRANLGQNSAFTKAALCNLGKEGSPSSPDLCIPTQH